MGVEGRSTYLFGKGQDQYNGGSCRYPSLGGSNGCESGTEGGSSIRVGDSQEGGKDYIREILTSGSSGSQDSDSEGWDTNDKVFDK